MNLQQQNQGQVKVTVTLRLKLFLCSCISMHIVFSSVVFFSHCIPPFSTSPSTNCYRWPLAPSLLYVMFVLLEEFFSINIVVKGGIVGFHVQCNVVVFQYKVL